MGSRPLCRYAWILTTTDYLTLFPRARAFTRSSWLALIAAVARQQRQLGNPPVAEEEKPLRPRLDDRFPDRLRPVLVRAGTESDPRERGLTRTCPWRGLPGRLQSPWAP